MSNKSFVSLLISSNKLQLIKLDSTNSKIEKSYEADIPSELIKDYKVVDEAKLSGFIKTSFKQAKVSEKNVGIIIPEFSTYTKLIELPGLLEGNDLDEAVRWQAKDFVPASEDDLVMDWKILDSQVDKNSILFVAIDKKVLTGYVDAVSKAGLYPLVVETQSLALARMASMPGKLRLVMYNNFGEVILLIANGEQILGSSVIDTQNENEVVNTANEMIKHYAQNEVEKIVVGGKGFSEQFYQKLKNMISVPVVGMQKTIPNIADQQFQEFIIPISQQLQDPYEPSDDRSVNLLPPSWIRKYNYKKLSRRIWSLMFVASLVLWSCLAAVGGNYIYLNSKLTKLEKQEEIEDQEVLVAVSEIEKINQKITTVNSIAEADIMPQEVINSITSASSNGVSIRRTEIDLDKGAIIVYGLAPTRDNLVAFKQSLESNESLTDVRIPISTLAEETDIEFTLTLKYAAIHEDKPLKLKLN